MGIIALMAARLDTVAKFVCEQNGWRLSNLPLQKILYLAQVEYMGRSDGRRLTDTSFEAWDLGPVSPDLYQKLKVFGARPVRDVFDRARRFEADDPRADFLVDVCNRYAGKKPGTLVELTHWDFGAWAQKYEPNVKGILITDEDIGREYRNRKRHHSEWERISERQ